MSRSKSYFEYLGHVVKLVLQSTRNTKGQVEFDGDSLNLKVNDISIAEATSSGLTLPGTLTAGALTVTTLSPGTGGVVLAEGVVQKTAITTLTATEIVGSTAGDIGSTAGAPLVAAPGAGYALQFVNAVLIYDYATGAYAGGNEDLVVRVGTVTASGAIADAALIDKTSDTIINLSALTTDYVLTANSTINLHGTAITAGTGAGTIKAIVTYNVITTGL